MRNKYLAVLDNREIPRAQIIRLHKGENTQQVTSALGLDLDLNKCEWMAGEIAISINIQS